jgi:hypothetical protein
MELIEKVIIGIVVGLVVVTFVSCQATEMRQLSCISKMVEDQRDASDIIVVCGVRR